MVHWQVGQDLRGQVHLQGTARVEEERDEKVFQGVARNVTFDPHVHADGGHDGHKAEVAEPGHGPAAIEHQLQQVEDQGQGEQGHGDDQDEPGWFEANVDPGWRKV